MEEYRANYKIVTQKLQIDRFTNNAAENKGLLSSCKAFSRDESIDLKTGNSHQISEIHISPQVKDTQVRIRLDWGQTFFSQN